MVRRLCKRFRFLEERQLFGRRPQAIDPKGHALQPDAPPETTSKQAGKHRLEIGLPIGAAVEQLLRGLLVMVAVPDGEHHASTDAPLLPERRAKGLHQSV